MATGAMANESAGTPYRLSATRGSRNLVLVSAMIAASPLASIRPLFADVGTAAEAEAGADSLLAIAVRDEAGQPVVGDGHGSSDATMSPRP